MFVNQFFPPMLVPCVTYIPAFSQLYDYPKSASTDHFINAPNAESMCNIYPSICQTYDYPKSAYTDHFINENTNMGKLISTHQSIFSCCLPPTWEN